MRTFLFILVISIVSLYACKDTNVTSQKENAKDPTVVYVPTHEEWEDCGAVAIYKIAKRSAFSSNEDGLMQSREVTYVMECGEGSLYRKERNDGSVQYQLWVTFDNGETHKYAVALGTFNLNTDDGSSQFKAHAGSYYFDL